eukprot:m.193571 g.193571  ORF g.193571 m.193571 type:complete len:310 (-) comp32506_c5_seq1:115-1044(-)
MESPPNVRDFTEKDVTAISNVLKDLSNTQLQQSFLKQFRQLSLLEVNDGLRNIYGILWGLEIKHSSFFFHCRRLINNVVELGLEQLNFVEHEVVTPSKTPFAGLVQQDQICAVTMMRHGEIITDCLQTCCVDISIGHVLVTEDAHAEDGAVLSTTLLKDHGVSTSDVEALVNAGLATVDDVAYASLDTVTKLSLNNLDVVLREASMMLHRNSTAKAFYSKLTGDISSRKVLLFDVCISSPFSILKAIEVLLEQRIRAEKISILSLFVSAPALMLITRVYPKISIVAAGVFQDASCNFNPNRYESTVFVE